MKKPNAPACERNREPILAILKKTIHKQHTSLLEIGSGTGQHAVYFAPSFPNLTWLTSDVKANHPNITMWLNDANINNIKGPAQFEIGKDEFPKGQFDIVFSANSLHIMSWQHVVKLITMLGEHMEKDAYVLFYGPFNYNEQYTSDSNATFDNWLKEQSPDSAIRGFEDIDFHMKKAGFSLVQDYEMPANNRTLVFRKTN